MILSIVVPCYNEEAVLEETAARLLEHVERMAADGKIAASSRIYFVDDGSRDRTWPIIRALAARHASIKGIKLTRNRGHQVALLAGLLTVPGDAVISVDADLQDDLAAMSAMVDEHRAGAQIVYGVRRRRDTDSTFKRLTAEWYGRLLARLGVEVVFNHADFRLMGRAALNALATYSEANLFLRGLIPQLGYTTSIVYYDRAARFAGESKYAFPRMLALAWDGITSFSAAPLRFITALGFLVSIGSLSITVWALWVRFFGDSVVPGWASTVLPIYFLGGIQLLAIGMVGEYLAKTYLESKRRPRYIIETILE